MNKIRIMTPIDYQESVPKNHEELVQSLIKRINSHISSFSVKTNELKFKLNDCTFDAWLTEKVLADVKEELELSNWNVLILELKEPNVLFVNIQSELEDK